MTKSRSWLVASSAGTYHRALLWKAPETTQSRCRLRPVRVLRWHFLQRVNEREREREKKKKRERERESENIGGRPVSTKCVQRKRPATMTLSKKKKRQKEQEEGKGGETEGKTPKDAKGALAKSELERAVTISASESSAASIRLKASVYWPRLRSRCLPLSPSLPPSLPLPPSPLFPSRSCSTPFTVRRLLLVREEVQVRDQGQDEDHAEAGQLERRRPQEFAELCGLCAARC